MPDPFGLPDTKCGPAGCPDLEAFPSAPPIPVSESRVDNEILVNTSGNVIADNSGAVADRYNPPCKSMAKCTTLTVYLPLGAQITKVRYFHENIYNHNWYEAPPGTDLAWALHEPANVHTTPTNVVVTSVFKNWSHTTPRGCRMDVWWKK